MSNTTQGLLIDPLILTEDQILSLYQKAYSLLLEGKTFMAATGNGTEFRSEFPIPVTQMLSECRYALRQVNPKVYGHNTTLVAPFFV